MRPTIILRHGESTTKRWLLFGAQRSILTATTMDDVMPVLHEAEQARKAGHWVAGFVSYDAAPGIDPSLVAHARADGNAPLAWFAVCEPPTLADKLPSPTAPASSPVAWHSSTSDEEHAMRVEQVRNLIANGDTYQVNLTRQLHASFESDAYTFFHERCQSQPPPFAAYIHTAGHDIVSLSPELFFQHDGKELLCQPMKGTFPRGRWYADDEAQRQALITSEKNRAENAMIVDMVRNDCGKIATPGSVRVTSAFDVRAFGTVWHMTSTVSAHTRADFPTIMRALFPCASITGAPKVRTMQIIRDLEKESRGLYCGAIGYLAPNKRSVFSVAIRTMTIKTTSDSTNNPTAHTTNNKTDKLESRTANSTTSNAMQSFATYGTGGGVVWDSTSEDEVAETWIKTRALTEVMPPVTLLETLAWRPRTGYRFLAGHIRRLQQSAAYFSIPFCETRIRQALDQATATFADKPARVRLLLTHEGVITIEHVELTDIRPRVPRRLALAKNPVDEKSIFLYHKTCERSAYTAARNSAPTWADDVLLYNSKGEITESLIANALFLLDGVWVTPPLASGVLEGVFRNELIARGRMREAVVRVEDLTRVERILLVNSVRGFMPAVMHQAK